MYDTNPERIYLWRVCKYAGPGKPRDSWLITATKEEAAKLNDDKTSVFFGGSVQ